MRRHSLVLSVLLVAAPLIWDYGARAETTGEASIFDRRDQAEEDALRAAEEAAAQRVRAERLEAELASLSERLASIGPRIVDRERSLTEARDRLDRLGADVSTARERLRATNKRLAKLSSAMQRAAREPTPSLLVNPDRPVEAARSAFLLRLLSRDLAEAKAAAKADLDAIALASDEARQVEASAQRDLIALQDDESIVRELFGRKRATLREANEAARKAALAAEALKAKAETLSDFAAALDTIPTPSVRRRPEPPRAAEPAERPPSGQIVKRKRQSKPFDKAKGEMPFPVAGKLVVPDKRVYSTAPPPGVFFVTRPFARVIAPWDGLIRYAGDFPEYGKIVILEPQKGYQLLITGLALIDRQAGEDVLMGEPLGRMGGPKPTSSEFLFEVSDTTSGARERLYFEIRKRGKPILPSQWFDTGVRKVSGL